MNRARTTGGIPSSRTAYDMDNEFESGCEKWPVFCCPRIGIYGILNKKHSRQH